MNSLGREIRLNRLFSPKDGRMVAIMFDHTIARGLMDGLIPVWDKIAQVVSAHPDAMTMHKGIAERCFAPHAGEGVSLILKAATPCPYVPGYSAYTADPEEALAAGADAIAIGCILGGAEQPRGIENAARAVKEAHRMGLPVIGHFYPNGEQIPKEDREEWRNVAYAARAGAELGIDVMKIHHSGDPDEFARIVEAVPARVVLAGGRHGPNVEAYLEMTRNVIQAGAAGVAFGRFVWEYPNPAPLVEAIKLIVHENADVKQAMELLRELEQSKG